MDSKGFSLIEVLVVIGIMAILIGLTAPTLVNTYRDYTFRGEQDLVGSLLRTARTYSMVGRNGKDHGVKIASASYVVFEGPSYTARDTSQDVVTARDTNITVAGASEILFTYLTGRSSTTTLVLTDTMHTGSISINQEGLISW